MTNLSVNINKFATLRNARGGNLPDVLQAARDCERFGADGITVHPRPDERHIRRQDVVDLKPMITTEFNIEGNPVKSFLRLVMDVKPTQCTLVPDAVNAVTSNKGWDTVANRSFLSDVVKMLHDAGIRVSVFVDPDVKMIAGAKEVNADRIELYTGPYAEQFSQDKKNAVVDYVIAAKTANDLGLAINAGHDLNLKNLNFFARNIPQLSEVSIGHSLICDAIYLGLENTIQLYRRALEIS